MWKPGSILICSLVCTNAIADDDFEQHAAHEHGKVAVNIAIDGNTLRVELYAPALHVVGFEHAPRSDAERRASAAAGQWLRAGRGIVGVPRGAACRLSGSEVTTPDSGPDHEAEAQHSDYEAAYTFECAAPQALAWVELWLLDRLEGVEELEVSMITPRGTTSRELPATERRIALR